MKSVSLNGPWQCRDAAQPDADWIPADVPGCIHTDLMAAGRIPDPFRRLNEADVQWVGERDWVYRRQFEADADLLSHPRIELVCNGLDTFATLRLNGREIAKTENAFVEHVFDVTGVLTEGPNELEIRFDSALRVCAEREAERGKLPGGPRVHARKPQYSFGLDWGPALPYCGVWRDIFLRAFTYGRIDTVHAPTELADGAGRVNVRVELDRLDEEPLTVNLMLSRGTEIVAEAELHELAGSAQATLEVEHPLPWSPAGSGDPDLYDLLVRLRQGGQELDRREMRIGFRTCEIERQPDDAGESFIFKINGRRTFCKGANWIPADSFPHRVSAAKYRALVQAAVDQNMNMLRVWGGGIYEADAFFEACDELGVMVWHDFMFACGDYPDRDDFRDLVAGEAQAVVKRLRHHPSLVVWCGNNENHMGHDNWGWPETFSAEPIYARVLPETCERLDPGRTYWPGSPYGGDNSNSETHGDMHNWKVWHGGADYRKYLDCRARFVSEFGFQSFPTMDTLLEFAEPEDLAIDSEVMRGHQKCGTGSERLAAAIDLFFPKPDGFERTVLFTQMVQGEALKLAIEHWRCLKWHTAGTLIWQLNDCWPVISWALVDGSMRPKPAAYYVRRAYAPVLLTAQIDGDVVVVCGVNDTAGVLSGTVDIERFTMHGEATLLRSGTIELAGDSSGELCRLPLAEIEGLDHRREFLWLTLYSGIYDASTTLLFNTVRELDLLPPDIQVEVETDPYDHQQTVRLTSSVFVKGAWLSVPGANVTFSDNAFDLVPYVSHEVTAHVGEGPPVQDLQTALRIQYCNPPAGQDS